MVDEYHSLDWKKVNGSLAFNAGEIGLGGMRLNMIRCAPNIFDTPELELTGAPVQEMANAQVNSAYLYSCPIKTALEPVSVSQGLIRYTRQIYKHYYIDLNQPFETYEKSLNSKTLNSIKRKSRKIDRTNSTVETLKIYEDVDSFEEFFELAMPISLASYQHRMFSTGLPQHSDFRKEIELMAREKKVRGYILFIQDKPAAYNLCPLYGNGVMLYDYTGYIDSFSNFSPGLILQYSIIRSAFEDDAINIYDLCTGEGQHKSTLTTEYKYCANVFFIRKSLRTSLGVALARALDRGTEFIKLTLDKFELKNTVKNLFRKK